MNAFLERLNQYEKLMRLDRPIGILLLLWPTLWGVWLSTNGLPTFFFVWVFVLGTVLMRSAGCIMNDLADRRFDGHVERTRERPLVTGAVSTREAVMLAVLLSACAFVLIIPLPKLVWALSVAALFLAMTYPYTKRFLSIPQAYLGVCFGFGIPMAFAAAWLDVPPVAWLVMAANVFWCIAYDTEYAMVDRNDDLKIGIKTSAITFGRFDVLAVMLCYAASLALLVRVGFSFRRGWIYFAALAVAACIAGYHYYLIRDRDRARCFKAFLHNNWFGAVVFAGIALDYLVHPVELAPAILHLDTEQLSKLLKAAH